MRERSFRPVFSIRLSSTTSRPPRLSVRMPITVLSIWARLTVRRKPMPSALMPAQLPPRQPASRPSPWKILDHHRATIAFDVDDALVPCHAPEPHVFESYRERLVDEEAPTIKAGRDRHHRPRFCVSDQPLRVGLGEHFPRHRNGVLVDPHAGRVGGEADEDVVRGDVSPFGIDPAISRRWACARPVIEPPSPLGDARVDRQDPVLSIPRKITPLL